MIARRAMFTLSVLLIEGYQNTDSMDVGEVLCVRPVLQTSRDVPVPGSWRKRNGTCIG
jgi:hypothetical protein